MSDNEKDARYTLENMVGNVIMVMGKGREWEGDDAVRRILYGIMLETLTSKRTETKWGGWLETTALSYKITNGEQRENGNCYGDCPYYENYVSRGINAYGG
jgi:hypothetical protein